MRQVVSVAGVGYQGRTNRPSFVDCGYFLLLLNSHGGDTLSITFILWCYNDISPHSCCYNIFQLSRHHYMTYNYCEVFH